MYPQPYVKFVKEIDKLFQTVTVLMENTMMEQLNVKLAHAIMNNVSTLQPLLNVLVTEIF